MTINIKTYDRTFGELSKNNNITENGIYTYLCLTPFINSNCTYLPINVAELNSILSNVANNKKQKDYIKTGLQKLEQADLIKIISISNNKYDYELDLDNMVEPYDKKNPYTVFPVDSFRQTLKDCHNKKTIFKFLSSYFYELTHNEASMDGSEMFYFNATREELAESCGIDIRSLDKYLYILQKNKIIYVHKYNYKYRDSGKQLPNAYGLYKNKDIIDSKCNDYLNEHKDEIYYSPIPRGKGSMKKIATDEELAEHDSRHKEVCAKKDKKEKAKEMEKAKTVVIESVPIEEVEEVVQADSKDFDAIIAERKAENEAILSDSNKEETVQADKKHKITIEEFERKWHNKPVQKAEKKKIEKVAEPVETHRVDRDEEYKVIMSELKLNNNTTFDKASKMFDSLLLEKFGFVNEDDDDKALKERFNNEWERSITVPKVEPIIEKEEENPFA